MTFRQLVAALDWYFAEKGLSRAHTALKAFAEAGLGSGVTAPGGVTTFGDLELTDATMVDQTPTGFTGLIAGNTGIVNPGADQIPGSTVPAEPVAGFRN